MTAQSLGSFSQSPQPAHESLQGDEHRSVLVLNPNSKRSDHFQRLLAADGFSVTQACAIEAAWSAVEERSYPIVVVDGMAPEDEVLRWCSRLRAMSSAARVFILIISMRPSRLEHARWMRAGVDIYLTEDASDALLLSYLDAAVRVAQFVSR